MTETPTSGLLLVLSWTATRDPISGRITSPPRDLGHWLDPGRPDIALCDWRVVDRPGEVAAELAERAPRCSRCEHERGLLLAV